MGWERGGEDLIEICWDCQLTLPSLAADVSHKFIVTMSKQRKEQKSPRGTLTVIGFDQCAECVEAIGEERSTTRWGFRTRHSTQATLVRKQNSVAICGDGVKVDWSYCRDDWLEYFLDWNPLSCSGIGSRLI